MARLINASIDLSKIDKTKIITTEKGKYLNITISVNDEKNKFDQDTSIFIQQSKDERENKEKKVYIGNGKTFWSNDFNHSHEPTQTDTGNDDLPF